MKNELRVAVSAADAERLRERRSEVIEIDPDGLYGSLEVAIILGYGGTDKNRRSQVSAIPDAELTRTPTGPRGGNIMFQGRDIIAYLQLRRERRLKTGS